LNTLFGLFGSINRRVSKCFLVAKGGDSQDAEGLDGEALDDQDLAALDVAAASAGAEAPEEAEAATGNGKPNENSDEYRVWYMKFLRRMTTKRPGE